MGANKEVQISDILDVSLALETAGFRAILVSKSALIINRLITNGNITFDWKTRRLVLDLSKIDTLSTRDIDFIVTGGSTEAFTRFASDLPLLKYTEVRVVNSDTGNQNIGKKNGLLFEPTGTTTVYWVGQDKPTVEFYRDMGIHIPANVYNNNSTDMISLYNPNSTAIYPIKVTDSRNPSLYSDTYIYVASHLFIAVSRVATDRLSDTKNDAKDFSGLIRSEADNLFFSFTNLERTESLLSDMKITVKKLLPGIEYKFMHDFLAEAIRVADIQWHTYSFINGYSEFSEFRKYREFITQQFKMYPIT